MPIVYRESDAWWPHDTSTQEFGSIIDIVGDSEEDAYGLLVMVLGESLPTITHEARKQVLVIRRGVF